MATLQTTAVTGSLTVTGQLIAQSLNVQQVTSSIVYSSGSNIFGKLVTDVQQLTGSLRVTGSGEHWVMGGNVGIGTTSPGYKLDVIGQIRSVNSNDQIIIKTSGTTGTRIGHDASGLYFANDDTSLDVLRIFGGTAGSQRLAINTNGNVGIGTTSPSYKLHVDGEIGLPGTIRLINGGGTITYINEAYGINLNGDATHPIQVNATLLVGYNASGGSYGTNNAYIAGNVGIGTTSPATKLALAGSTATTFGLSLEPSGWNNARHRWTVHTSGDVSTWAFNWNGSAADSALYAVAAINVTQGVISFSTTGSANAPTERMRVASDGNVGIGTTSPSTKTHIRIASSGATPYDNGLTVENSGRVALNLLSGTSYDSYVFFGNPSAGNAGYVGYENSTNRLVARSTGYISLVDGTGEIVRVTGGNVGIGTSSPSQKLDVNGNILTNSVLYAGSVSSTRITVDGGSIQGYFSSEANARFLIGRDIYTSGQSGIALGGGGSFIMIGDASTTVGTAMAFAVGASSGGGPSAEKMRITSGGNVGIGIATPQNTLHLYATTYPFIQFTNSVTGNGSGDGFRIGYEGSEYGLIDVRENVPLVFQTNATERMRITSGGNVGIGTTSPGAKLDVRSQIQIKGDTNEQLILDYTAASGNYTYQSFRVNGTNKYRIFGYVNGDFALYSDTGSAYVFYAKYDGNVGINSTSPGYTLDVVGSLKTTAGTYLGTSSSNVIIGGTTSDVIGSFKFITIGNTAFQYGASTGTYLRIEPGNADTEVALKADARSGAYPPMTFYTTATERMRIKADGNVGIGTTSPVAELDILGPDGSVGTVRWANAGGRKAGFLYSDSAGVGIYDTNFNDAGIYLAGNTQIDFRVNGSQRMLINSSGNVGIGTTSPGVKLYVSASDADYATIIKNTNTSGYGLQILTAGSSTNLAFQVRTNNASTNAFQVLDNGNVGIGTTNPGYKLTIQGSAGIEQSEEYFYFNSTYSVGNNARGKIRAVGTGGGSGYGGDLRLSSRASNNVWNEDALTIAYTGNVGVNTSAPAYKFQSNGPNGDWSGYFKGSSSSGNSYGMFIDAGTTSADSPFMVRSADGATTFLRIRGDGNIGIGTTAPAYTLDINGSQRSYNGSSYEVVKHGTFSLNDGTAGNFNHFITVGTTNVYATSIELTLSEVNIGHSVIKYTIITDYDDLNDTTKRIVLPLYSTNPRFESAGGTYGGAVHELQMWSDGSGTMFLRLVVQTRGSGEVPNWYWTAKLKNCDITATPNTTGNDSSSYGIYRYTQITQRNSNFGIGTKKPTTKLEVIGDTSNINGYADGAIQVTSLSPIAFVATSNLNPSLNRWGFRLREVNEGDFSIYDYRSSVNRLLINSSGYVGIGTTSPANRLQIGSAGSSGYGGNDILIGNGTQVMAFFQSSTISHWYTNTSFSLMPAGSGGVGYVGIGNTSPSYRLDVSGDIRATGDVIAYSDARVKDNINTIEAPLDLITKLRGVTYTRKDTDDKSRKVGVIAQEVLPILPEVVQKDTNGNYSVAYGNIVGVLIEAIKELKAEIDILKNK